MSSKVLFLGCNSNQVPYLNYLKSEGYKVIGVDINEEAPGKNLCDTFYNYSYEDIDSLLILGEKENFKTTDKVFTASAQFANKSNAVFAEKFNIEHPKENIIDFCLNKFTYYNYFLENDIPIPQTYFVQSKEELDKKLSEITNSKHFFLKSDFSKNPNYVYRINVDHFNPDLIFLGRDRYLRNYYILQDEFIGDSLRINIYGDRFNVIDFYSSQYTYEYHHLLEKFLIIETLKNLISRLGLNKWLIKFDIVLNKDEYVVLDIGLDPPSRMIKKARSKKINFEEFYIKQYIEGEICYPEILD